MSDNSTRQPLPTRPEHSEAYWSAIKYVILGLAALMVVALVLAVAVALRSVPWS